MYLQVICGLTMVQSYGAVTLMRPLNPLSTNALVKKILMVQVGGTP